MPSRFGLFLRQLRATETHTAMSGTGVSLWSGVAIIALGVLVLVASVVQHLVLVRELRTGTWRPGRVSRNAVVLALCSRLQAWESQPTC